MANSRFSIAVHTLALLARSNDQPLKSEVIARLVKTNPVVIRRLLSELARANLVVSQAGATGGTKLARKPEDVLLVEVYRTVADKQIFALPRKSPDYECEIGRSIEAVMVQIQNKFDRAIEENLGKITLAEVLLMIEDENKSCQERIREKSEKLK